MRKKLAIIISAIMTLAWGNAGYAALDVSGCTVTGYNLIASSADASYKDFKNMLAGCGDITFQGAVDIQAPEGIAVNKQLTFRLDYATGVEADLGKAEAFLTSKKIEFGESGAILIKPSPIETGTDGVTVLKGNWPAADSLAATPIPLIKISDKANVLESEAAQAKIIPYKAIAPWNSLWGNKVEGAAATAEDTTTEDTTDKAGYILKYVPADGIVGDTTVGKVQISYYAKTPTPTPVSPDVDDGGSSGGCNTGGCSMAGFGLLALAGIIPVLLKRKSDK